MTDTLPRFSLKELAYKIKGYGSPRFAFFLGAGASRQSGIITAGEMIDDFTTLETLTVNFEQAINQQNRGRGGRRSNIVALNAALDSALLMQQRRMKVAR